MSVDVLPIAATHRGKTPSGGLTAYFGINFSNTLTGPDNEAHDVSFNYSDTNWHTLDNGTNTLRVRCQNAAPSGYFDNDTGIDERLDTYGYRTGTMDGYIDFELPADTYTVDGAFGAASFSGNAGCAGYNGLDTTLLLFDNSYIAHSTGEWADCNISTLYSAAGWLAKDPATTGIQIVITDRGASTGFRMRWSGFVSSAWRVNYVRFYT